ncbi:sulfite exporter TauE/SafE family protein [Microbulbifer flavimaris]|uniref:Sulfite exporter TauE/SafE family protein n=1 Tax=Microbulbifer flavimaris TaxID=1781068 RepID=A0ABX4HWI9_9GAMM|nr:MULTISPECIES: sulfite exporter TauE/SafE family protein [Microbulbifer]PCO04462.1 sulfite exporter TauE/SafE family protein [Microbulbifer flavimaris]
MSDWGFVAAALAIGFFGSSHCIGMCGGISSALGMAVPGRKPAWGQLVSYSAGRLGSYALMGAIAGALGAAVLPTLTPLRVLAGLMLVAMALYIAGWWRGLVWLERGGAHLWRYLQPLSRQLLPVNSAPQALALGSIWGWLPCGLVYSALTFALAQGGSGQAALAMFAFGLGTVPAMFATGAAGARVRELVQRPRVRILMALLILLFGLWTIWGAVGHAGHGAHGSHTGHGEPAVESTEPGGHHHHH